jgi:hypothetical protein
MINISIIEKGDIKIMSKISVFLLSFILLICCSCERKTEEPIEYSLSYYLEKNGDNVEKVIKAFYNRKDEEWKIIDGKEYIHRGGLIVKYAIYYGETCIGFEMESEEEAKIAVKNQLKISNSLHYKGKFVFPTKLCNFVFFYDEDEIQGNRRNGYWIEENGEKSLLMIGRKHPIEDGVITIDGYQRVSQLALSGVSASNFKSVIIGKDVKILYAGAITGKIYDKIEFVGEIEEIHGSLVSINHPDDFYTVIPKSVKYIGNFAFENGNIFCEQDCKPESWDSGFVCKKAKVYWAGEWEYDGNGVPRPIQK